MTTEQTIIQSPLAAVHLGAGAKMGVWFGCALPDDFGDARAEQRFALESVALIDKNYRAYLSLNGPDRVRYLNAILTNNVKELAAGQGNVSLLLNPQGRILAEIETYAFAERLFCVSYAMIREKLIEWLDKYIIMDDVTLSDNSEGFGTLALEGPKAAAIVNELCSVGLAALPELSFVDAKVEANPGRYISFSLTKRSPGGIAGAEFVVAREHLAPLWNILAQAVRRHGGGPMGYSALSAQRIVEGVPWFGYDFGDRQIPHEAGLQDSHISYTKGCYTGQEIVERVRSRGQVNRQRVELIFSGDAVPTRDTPLTFDSKDVGGVTRAAKNWFPPSVIGLGYVRREHAAAGNVLQWSGGSATVGK